MRAKLFKYQQEGASWLASKKYAFNADEMGLGKTRQGIAAVEMTGAYPALVICPAIGRLNWLNEWSTCSGRTLKATPILTAASCRDAASSDVVTCSYDLATASDVFSMLSARRWGSLLLDEAHYLKEPDARRTQAVLGAGGLIHGADRAWAFSGTPTPNHAGELWPWLFTTGVVGQHYRAFFERYCVEQAFKVKTARGVIERTRVVGGQNYEELSEIMAPHVIRRTTEQVFPDMPPIVHSEIVVEPGEMRDDLWQAAWPEYLLRRNPHAELQETVQAGMSKLETFLRTLAPESPAAQQVLAGLTQDLEMKTMRRYLGIQMVQPLSEMVADELRRGEYEKIVIFGWHKDTLQLLRDALRPFGAQLVFGGTPAHKRDYAVKAFQNDPRVRVFVGNIQAAGTTITLHAANQVLVAEADWTDDYNTQAIKRCHRIGQHRTVFVRWAMTNHPVHMKITTACRRKAKHNLELLGAITSEVPREIDPFS